ncbi:MAG TPA: serine/threonine-protein kinase [Pyrinomonadaceae bacterium]|jgi:serine/threonine-protein kinase|nr:serine/threonine-protein kinase [Pyrinomonadaceae bacterium]
MKTCPQCGASYEPSVKFCPRDGRALKDAPRDLVGQTLDGQYEIEAFVARGGMGAVYRARHALLGDRVAIKVLRPEFRSHPEWLRRFLREGQASRRFRHQNAVTVYDLRTSDEGLVYMVLELVDGRSLDAELKLRGRFTPAEAYEVLEPVARVLEEAHEQGVVHRDLKPENVMMRREEDGELCVKLLDLGIAKLREIADERGAGGVAVGGGAGVEGGRALTVAGQILGTPQYMSPEQWGELPRDGGSDVDGRADIYSLAVMFYELVAGARPFAAKTLVELRHAHVALDPPPLEEVVPGVPAGFARAVEHGMRKDRGDRPPTAAAFVDELRAALGLDADQDGPARAAVYEDEPTDTPEAAQAAVAGQGAARLTAHDEASLVAPTVILNPDGQGATAPIAATGAAAGHTSADPEAYPTDASVNGASEVEYAGRAASRATTPPPVVTKPGGARGVAPGDAPQKAPPVVGAGAGSLGNAPRAAKSSRAPIVVLSLAILLIVCGLIAGTGWFLWRGWQSSRASMLGAPPAVAPEAQAAGADERVEALSYWIEAFEDADSEQGERVARAGAISLASGQQFKFHFSPSERGYFYVVGPGEGNAPTTFLTAQPAGVLKTNQAAARADFAYPYGPGAVLQLDKNPGTEEYTVIYTATPLLAPKFLAARAGHELSPAELKELEDLRARARPAAPSFDVKDVGEGLRAVSVSAANAEAARLVVFDIRIEHQ